MALKFIYTLFLAILLTLFAGLGIDAFYKAPELPEYPEQLRSITPDSEEKKLERNRAEIDYQEAQDKYQREKNVYNRNVSIVAIVIAVFYLVISLLFLNKIKIIADGVLLGGVFLTVYSIVRGIMSDSSEFRFLIVSIGLAIALILGYIKFVKEDNLN
ncbi:MAG: hypothetical protein R6V40_00495 [Candidatus Moraniibacteriota bacterium]